LHATDRSGETHFVDVYLHGVSLLQKKMRPERTHLDLCVNSSSDDLCRAQGVKRDLWLSVEDQ
jgi:hypothetical protein